MFGASSSGGRAFSRIVKENYPAQHVQIHREVNVTDDLVMFGPGPALLSAEAILTFDADSLNNLYNVLGWETLGYSSVRFSADMLRRFGAVGNESVLAIIKKMSDERVISTAQMIAEHVGFEWRTIAKYGSRFLANSIIAPLSICDKIVQVNIDEPVTGEERELVIGMAIVNLVLIGIEVNVKHHSGVHATTPQSMIDDYRGKLPALYSRGL